MPDLLERLTQALADRYAVEREIGRGAMATVYLAEDLKHHRKVAIKVLHPELASTVGAERFLREIEIAAGLDHPHILTLLDSDETDGFLYYVMPFVEGESLRDYLEREPQLPIEEAIRIAHEVAEGLGHAHRHGVVHRDIKPANIMLSEGHALIADFGVARAVGGEGQALTSTGLAVGTPAYMSPEQASGGQSDARSDLYALGCVLYEMLAGLPPLTGPTPQATAALRLTETATPLPVIRETVPAGVERVVGRLLAKSPADRYAGADRLVEDLEDPGLWAEAKPGRSVWKRAASAAVALVILAFGIYATRWFASSPSPETELTPGRIVVATLDSRAGGDRADLDFLAAHWITEGLYSTGVVEVVPMGDALRSAEAVREQAASGLVTQPTLALASRTRAGIVVSVTHFEIGDSVRFFVEVMDAVRDTVLGMLEHKGARAEPEQMIGELRDETMSLLSTTVDDRLSDPLVTPATVPAYRAIGDYRKATQLFMTEEYDSAGVLYQAAFTADTTFVEALLWAMFSVNATGDRDRADSLLTEVLRRRDRLSEFHQSWADSYRAIWDGDLPAGLDHIRRASELRPGTTADLFRSYLALASNRPAEAAEAMDRVNLEYGLLAGWFNPWPPKASIQHMLGNHSAELGIAQHARRLFPERPMAVYLEARALIGLGRTEEAMDRVTEILEMNEKAYFGTRSDWATSLCVEFDFHGFPEEARTAIELALSFLEAMPVESRSARSYGMALYQGRRWDEAREVFTGTGDLDATSAGYLGLVAARQDDTAEAARMDNWLSGLNLQNRQWYPTTFRARIAAVLGDRERAVELLGQAITEGMYHPGHDHLLELDFESMADYEPYQELMRPKG